MFVSKHVLYALAFALSGAVVIQAEADTKVPTAGNTAAVVPVAIVGDVAGKQIKLESCGAEPVWKSAPKITAFTNPWNKEVNPPTCLSLLRDDTFLYFLFEVKDKEVLLEKTISKKRDIEREDRVELFFSKDKNMKDYYGFEVDANGRTLAYRCSFHRKFDFTWEPPAGYAATGRVHKDGYTVVGKIPLSFLKDFTDADGTVFFGAYRAEFSLKDGAIVENWLAWRNPGTPHPEFHVPSSLGKLKLGSVKK